MMEKFKDKEFKKNISKILLTIILSNFIALSLTNILYYSNNDKITNINSSTNNLYTTPAEYSTLLGSLNTIEGYFTADKKYNYQRMNLTSSNSPWLNFYYNGVNRGTIYALSSRMIIAANDASGTEGQGTLNLKGNPVQFNGVDVSTLADIGTIIKDEPSTAVSVANTTYTDVASISLPAGEWYICFSARFAYKSNYNSYREIRLGKTSGNNSMVYAGDSSLGNAETNQPTILNSAFYEKTTGNSTTYYLKARQNSGSAMNVYGRIYAIRLR